MFSATSVCLLPLTYRWLKGRNKKGKIEWNEEYIKAFEFLKKKLTSKPILHAPNFSKPFILQTDASDLGYGVALAQENDKGNKHPVLYFSKKNYINSKK